MPTDLTQYPGVASYGSLAGLAQGAGDPYGQIKAAYRQYLGRDPSDQEVGSQLGNGRAIAPQNVAYAINNIQNSPEAQAYRLAQANQAGANQTGAVTTPQNTGTTGTAGTFTPTNTGGAGAQNYAYTGFDFNQAASNRDTGRSAKYAFAQATQEAAAKGAGDIWKTKAGAETFAEQYIKPFMEQAGFKILEIVGDKMRVLTREAAEAGNTQGVWIDWVVNAGGDNPALAWQEEASRANFGPLESRYTTAATATTPTDSSGTGQTQTATGGSGQTTTGGENPDEDAQVASDFAYQPLIDPMSTLALY